MPLSARDDFSYSWRQFTLETALNLVWIIVSAGLLLICGTYVMRAGKNRSRGMAAVAMVCLICLLFPVISMTDDLNSGSMALLEPNKVKKLLSWTFLAATVVASVALHLCLSKTATWLPAEPELKSHNQDLLPFSLSRRPPPANSTLAVTSQS